MRVVAPSRAALSLESSRLCFAQVEFLPKADHFKGEGGDEYVFALKLES